MIRNIIIVRHPRSGERYACEIDDACRILRAAGPLDHHDPADQDSLEGWLSNADDAEDDGNWLQAELEGAQ